MDGHPFSRALDAPEPLYSDPARQLRAHEAASDPDTHSEILVALADEYPQEVLDNPVLPLVGLGDLTAWRRITTAARIQLATLRIARAVDGASRGALRRFSLDCAESVLPLWERRYPGAVHLRAVLDEARGANQNGPPWLSGWKKSEALFTRAMLWPQSHLLDGSPIDDVALVLILALDATRTKNAQKLRELALDVAWATASAAVIDEDDEAPRADEMERLAALIEAADG